MKKQLTVSISLFVVAALIAVMIISNHTKPWQRFAKDQLDGGLVANKSHPHFMLSELKYREASAEETRPASEIVCASFVVHRNKSGAVGGYINVYYYGYSAVTKVALSDEKTGDVIAPKFSVVPNPLDVHANGSVYLVNFVLHDDECSKVCSSLTSSGLKLAIYLADSQLNQRLMLSNIPLLDSYAPGAEEFIYFPKRWNAQISEAFPGYRDKMMDEHVTREHEKKTTGSKNNENCHTNHCAFLQLNSSNSRHSTLPRWTVMVGGNSIACVCQYIKWLCADQVSEGRICPH